MRLGQRIDNHIADPDHQYGVHKGEKAKNDPIGITTRNENISI